MKILKFSATWCNPCKALSKMIATADLTKPVEEVDIDEQTEIATKFQIRGVPTLVKVDEAGQEVDRKVGMFLNKTALEEWVNG